MNDPALISLIVPVYNEAEALPELIAELSTLQTNRFGDHFEFVLGDDGSTDDTWQTLLSWAQREPRLALVRLAGNRGAHCAVKAGLEAASGDAMIVIPADLQEGLDLVEACLEAWHRAAPMVVMMVPKQGRVYQRRSEGLAASAFYAILRAGTGLYKDLSVRAQAKLTDRVATDAFLANSSTYALLTPFVLRQGFPCEVVYYDGKPRSRGNSKWNLAKKTALMTDMLLDTSSRLLSPWRIAAAGLGVYGCLWLTGLSTGVHWLGSTWFSGAFLSGLLLAVASVLGIHVGRIHQELRGRPAYVVRERRGSQIHQNPAGTGHDSNYHASLPKSGDFGYDKTAEPAWEEPRQPATNTRAST